ncbi:hypothetical protein [Crocosphaera watsonii]|nr:hypothetical protein [Crocosphaera watsonii]
MNTESPKTKKSGRGGKRKGAGRKSTSRTTKLMRVPENCPHINGLLELRDIIFTLRDEYESNPKAKTSPRWQKVRELMENIDFDSLKDKETN